MKFNRQLFKYIETKINSQQIVPHLVVEFELLKQTKNIISSLG